MATPISISRNSLITRVIPGTIATVLLFTPTIVAKLTQNNGGIDLINNPETTTIALFVVLVLLTGTAINYVRINYYYVPSEFRNLVYMDSGNIIAYTWRKRCVEFIKDLYCSVRDYIIHNDRLSSFIEKHVISYKDRSDISSSNRPVSVKEMYLSNHLPHVKELYTSDNSANIVPRLKEYKIREKSPNASYNEKIGVNTIKKLKKINNLERNFGDSKYLYYLLMNELSSSMTKKGREMRNVYAFYKNVSIAYKHTFPASLLYHLIFTDVLNLWIVPVIFLYIVIWPYFTMFDIIENLDAKYTRHILLEYAVEKEMPHTIH